MASRSAAASGQEPVWLVRLVFILFLVGFAAFLAREIVRFTGTVP